MKIKILVPICGLSFSYTPGDVVEINDAEAKRWIDAGHAAKASKPQISADKAAKADAEKAEKAEQARRKSDEVAQAKADKAALVLAAKAAAPPETTAKAS